MGDLDHGEDIEDLLREAREERDQMKISYNMACANLREMNDKCKKLVEALNIATLLLEQLLTDMRLADVTPTSKVIVTKARLDQIMRAILGQGT